MTTQRVKEEHYKSAHLLCRKKNSVRFTSPVHAFFDLVQLCCLLGTNIGKMKQLQVLWWALKVTFPSKFLLFIKFVDLTYIRNDIAHA